MAERKIANVTYRVEPMPAKQALELLADISRVLGQGIDRLPGILLSLDGAASGEPGAGKIADVGVLMAIFDVVQANGSEDLRKLVERIASQAKYVGGSGVQHTVDLDAEFTGKLEAIPALLGFVLEVNFGSFFAASAGSGLLSQLRAVFQSAK